MVYCCFNRCTYPYSSRMLHITSYAEHNILLNTMYISRCLYASKKYLSTNACYYYLTVIILIPYTRIIIYIYIHKYYIHCKHIHIYIPNDGRAPSHSHDCSPRVEHPSTPPASCPGPDPRRYPRSTDLFQWGFNGKIIQKCRHVHCHV